ncbi:hypothetical protein D3C87_725560 [compost metagenome]
MQKNHVKTIDWTNCRRNAPNGKAKIADLSHPQRHNNHDVHLYLSTIPVQCALAHLPF